MLNRESCLLKRRKATRGFSLFRKNLERCEERPALAGKKSRSNEPSDCGVRSGESISEWANCRALREVGADELSRYREDQVRLKLGSSGVSEEVRKCQPLIRNRSDSRLTCIARKVDPLQKVRDLVATNAQRDLKHLCARDLLRQTRIKA